VFYSTALVHPTGVNLLANTAEVGIGVVLAPVTWLLGPVATLNVALTLSPVLSALAMFVLIRRWVSWVPAAFVGGLLYGFSPFVLVNLTDAHLMLGLGVVPPLVVASLDEMLVRQKCRPTVTGVILGLLLAVQFFIGTELLTITVILSGIGIALMAIYGARSPEVLRSRVRYAGVVLLAAGVTSVVLLAYPVWFALAGPAHYSGSIWPSSILGRGGTSFKNYLLPLPDAISQVKYLHQIGGYQGPALSNQYFGIGLIAVLIGGFVAWHRDRRLWLFGAIGLISILLSLGLENTFWVPWRVLVKLPLIQDIIPVRFVSVTFFVAAVMLGIIVDHAHLTASGWDHEARDRSLRPLSGALQRSAGVVAAVAVSMIALIPIASYLAQSIPMTTQTVVLPSWFRTIAPHLVGRQVLLVFPVPLTIDTTVPLQSAMTWQAVDTMHDSMIGGGGPASRVTPAGAQQVGQAIVASVGGQSGPLGASGITPGVITPGEIWALRQALVQWGVTMVVIQDQSDLPTYDQVPPVSRIAMVMSAAIGQRPIHQSLAWVWTAVNRAPPSPIPTRARLSQCTPERASRGVSSVEAATNCVLTAGQ
jgi:hypothetical protein